MAPLLSIDAVKSTLAHLSRRSDTIGGLTVGEVNLVVIGVIFGGMFMVSMGFGFARVYYGAEGMSAMGVRDPSPEQVNYMRQVRYRTRMGMFVASQNAMKAQRDSKITDEGSSYQV